MKAGQLLEPSSATFGELFATGRTYQVPPFQRDYSWTADQWEDLWNDLEDVSSRGDRHYMGAIVFRRVADGPWVIIDGQQRIATLSLVALAALSLIRDLKDAGQEVEGNQERMEILFGQFLGTRDAASLRAFPRLRLNRQDNAFYQKLIHFQFPLNRNKLKRSERLLLESYEYFRERIADWKPNAAGEQLAHFLTDTVAKRLLFLEIDVADEQSAYTVFETLNARGIELAPTDLVKNYLLSLVAESDRDIEEASESWEKIDGAIGDSDFPLFLRHHLAVSKPQVRRERLFRAVKEEVSTSGRVFPFLHDLESSSELYHALNSPYDVYWQKHPGIAEILRALNLYRVTQYRPLALAAYPKLEPREFVRVLRAIQVVSMRLNVIGRKGVHPLERVYNSIAMSITAGTITSAKQVIEALREIYVPDREFRDAFRYVDFPERSQRRLVLHILLRLEEQLTGKKTVDFETGDSTLEHILPENPDEDWDDIPYVQRSALTNRLGNLTLLEPKLNNRLAGNSGYSAKLKVYQQSQFQLTRGIASNVWSQAAIEQRQDQLAKLATAAWRL